MRYYRHLPTSFAVQGLTSIVDRGGPSALWANERMLSATLLISVDVMFLSRTRRRSARGIARIINYSTITIRSTPGTMDSSHEPQPATDFPENSAGRRGGGSARWRANRCRPPIGRSGSGSAIHHGQRHPRRPFGTRRRERSPLPHRNIQHTGHAKLSSPASHRIVTVNWPSMPARRPSNWSRSVLRTTMAAGSNISR